MTRDCSERKRYAEFKNVDRIAIIPVSYSSGESGSPMLVFKGTKVQYRVVNELRVEHAETIVNCLPPGSKTVTREDIRDMNLSLFYK